MKYEDFEQQLVQLQRTIHYTFQDRLLLEEAMTHSSYAHEHQRSKTPDNDRLEFLGDAVLDLLVGQRLFLSHRDFNSGRLTKERAHLVCEEALAAIAREMDLGPCLRLGVGEWRSGGADKNSLLADAYESLLGAVFLDGGLEAARHVALPGLDSIEEMAQKIFDAKSALQETCAKQKLGQPDYRLMEASGPDHLPVFTVECWLDEELLGRGEGRTRKQAEQKSARKAVEVLARRPVNDDA